MTATVQPEQGARYAWGGDEFLFVEMDESMNLAAFQRVSALAHAVAAAEVSGITDICQTNTSMLLRYDPDKIQPRSLKNRVQELELGINRPTSRTSSTSRRPMTLREDRRSSSGVITPLLGWLPP